MSGVLIDVIRGQGLAAKTAILHAFDQIETVERAPRVLLPPCPSAPYILAARNHDIGIRANTTLRKALALSANTTGDHTDEARADHIERFLADRSQELDGKLARYLNVDEHALPHLQDDILALLYDPDDDRKVACISYCIHHDLTTEELLRECTRLAETGESPLVKTTACGYLINYCVRSGSTRYLAFIINNVIKASTQPESVRTSAYLGIIGPAKLLEHMRRMPRGQIVALAIESMDLSYLDDLIKLNE